MQRPLVARLVGQVHLSRTLGRGREAIAGDTESADLQPNWRHRRRAYDVATGGDRRRAELGLSLLLDPRCHPDPLLAAELRLHRGGRGMAALAAALRRWAAGGDADHVWAGWRAPLAGAGAAMAGGLPRQPARSHRQRRPGAVPARCVWRADG